MRYKDQFRQPVYWLSSAALLVMVIAMVAATPVLTDEWWGNLVVKRVSSGELLYRDVFYGSTPLGVVFGLVARQLPAPDLLTLRAVNTVSVLVLLLITDYALFRVSRGALVRLAAIGTTALLLTPAAMAQIYTSPALALAFAATTLAAALRRNWAQAGSGALAAAAFSVKTNVGLTSIAIVLLIAAWRSPKPARAGSVARTAGGVACGVVVATVLPVVILGDWGNFTKQAILGRRDYIGVGSAGAEGTLQEFFMRATVGRPDLILADPGLLLLAIALASVIVSLVLLRRSNRAAVPLLGLFGCALSVAIPRPDGLHLGVAAPGLVIAIMALPATWPSGLVRRSLMLLGPTIVATCGAALLGSQVHGLGRLAAPDPGIAAAGAGFLRSYRDSELLAVAGEIRSHTTDPIFIVSGEAPDLYMLGDLKNPTRYDYPLTSNFTHAAQEDVVASIKAGAIGYVCIDAMTGPSAPLDFLNFVRTHLALVTKTRACDLYQAPISKDRPTVP